MHKKLIRPTNLHTDLNTQPPNDPISTTATYKSRPPFYPTRWNMDTSTSSNTYHFIQSIKFLKPHTRSWIWLWSWHNCNFVSIVLLDSGVYVPSIDLYCIDCWAYTSWWGSLIVFLSLCIVSFTTEYICYLFKRRFATATNTEQLQ